MKKPEIVVGAKVVYINKATNEREDGVVTSFNDKYAFVRYGSDVNSKATKFEDLEYIYMT